MIPAQRIGLYVHGQVDRTATICVSTYYTSSASCRVYGHRHVRRLARFCPLGKPAIANQSPGFFAKLRRDRGAVRWFLQLQVSLSVSAGLPAGATARFDPNPTAAISTLTVTTLATTPVGSYPLTVTRTGGGVTRYLPRCGF